MTDKTDKTNNKKSGWEKFRDSLGVIGSLAGFAGIVYGCVAFIDYRIKSVVQDENYVRRIAAEVQPSVIFNGPLTIPGSHLCLLHLPDDTAPALRKATIRAH
jgi:hypothetical protein